MHRGLCQNVTFLEYPILEIPDDSVKKSGTDWVLPKIIGSGIGYPSDTEHQAVWCKSFPLCKRNECYEADRRKQLPADPRLATVHAAVQHTGLEHVLLHPRIAALTTTGSGTTGPESTEGSDNVAGFEGQDVRK